MTSKFLAARINQCLTLGLIVVALLTLEGCQGSKRRLAAELTPITNPVNLDRAWSTSIGKSMAFSFKPLLVAGDLYASSEGGDLYKLNPLTGKVV